MPGEDAPLGVAATVADTPDEVGELSAAADGVDDVTPSVEENDMEEDVAEVAGVEEDVAKEETSVDELADVGLGTW